MSLFGGSKSGEKKRLIAKLQAHMQVLEGDRKGLAERVRKVGQTGGVALAMLKEEWAAVQAQLQAKARELEEAHDEMARHEAETLQLRTSVSGLRKQLEELERRPPVVVASAPEPAALVQIPAPVAVQQEQELQQRAEMGGALVVASVEVEAEARLVQLESELDMAYGKIEALSMQQSTSVDRGAALVRQLQAEVKEAKAQLAARVKKVRIRCACARIVGLVEPVLTPARTTHQPTTNKQYAELKERVRQLEEELEAAVGANEALRHAQDLRLTKTCVCVCVSWARGRARGRSTPGRWLCLPACLSDGRTAT